MAEQQEFERFNVGQAAQITDGLTAFANKVKHFALLHGGSESLGMVESSHYDVESGRGETTGQPVSAPRIKAYSEADLKFYFYRRSVAASKAGKFGFGRARAANESVRGGPHMRALREATNGGVTFTSLGIVTVLGCGPELSLLPSPEAQLRISRATSKYMAFLGGTNRAKVILQPDGLQLGHMPIAEIPDSISEQVYLGLQEAVRGLLPLHVELGWVKAQ